MPLPHKAMFWKLKLHVHTVMDWTFSMVYMVMEILIYLLANHVYIWVIKTKQKQFMFISMNGIWKRNNFIQWRLQEFYSGCSYSTLKKFRVILVYFGCFSKHRLKFKILPAWSLCLKKKKILKPKQICILYTKKPQKKKKWKENKWTNVTVQ